MQQAEITVKLIDQAAARRESAVSEIYQQTYTEVYSLIRVLVLDEEKTREILRETYVTGIQGISMLRDPAHLHQWLQMAAYSNAVAHLAKENRSVFSRMMIDQQEATEFDDEFPAEIPQIEMEKRVADALLLDLMRTLPADQRMCTVLYYYLRKDINQIARDIGISADNIRSRLNYSKWKIKARARELERYDVNLYGYKSREAIPFLVFLFQKHEELVGKKGAPADLFRRIMEELKQSPDPVYEERTRREEAARVQKKKQEQAQKRRRAKRIRTRIGLAFAVLLLAAVIAGVGFLAVRAYNQRTQKQDAAQTAAQADGTGTDQAGSAGTDGQLDGAGTDAAGGAGGAQTGSGSGTTVIPNETASDLPPEERIVGIYSEKAHENWMEIAKGDADDTFEVTFHTKNADGKDFSEAYQAKTDNTQLIVDSGTASGIAATLRWSNDYTVSVNESTWFETEKNVTVGGVYLNSETPLRGGTGVDAYLGFWVCMDDSTVDLTMQMSAGALRMVLYDDGTQKVDHSYIGFEVEAGVNGLPSKLRAHLSKDADETFWLYPDGTITFHSDGSPYDGKNFQQS